MMRETLQWFVFLTVFAVLPTANLQADEKPSDEFVKMIVKLIGDSDREFRAAGLDQVRTSAKGAAATQAFAAQLTKLDAEHQIALLSALNDRGDVAARTAVVDLIASSKDESVRASAITDSPWAFSESGRCGWGIATPDTRAVVPSSSRRFTASCKTSGS